MPESLGKVAAKYTALRLACVAVSFGVACAVLLPINGSSSDSVFEAALVGIAASIPLSFWLGRDLRVRMSEALMASREASRARVEDTAARVKAVEDARAHPGLPSQPIDRLPGQPTD